MMVHSGIVVRGVTKKYKNAHALDNVSVTFEFGKLYGLLGRNGAGKSSLLNIISNRAFANSGDVIIDGMQAKENDAAQRRLYLMSEASFYPGSMRFIDMMKWTHHFYGQAFDEKRAMQLCEMFHFSPKKKFGQFSTGYRSIAKIIIALSLNVPYVLLDEPVIGLDANHREVFYRELLKHHRERTLILSTHLIEEVATVVKEIVLINRGTILRTQSVEQMLSEGYTATGPASMLDAFVSDKSVIGMDAIGGFKIAYILGTCKRNEVPKGIEISRMDLQKLFLQLTK